MTTPVMPCAVVLVSGGLDSATCAAIARFDGFLVYALSFSYGQRHSIELDAAKRIAVANEAVVHRIVSLDLSAFGSSLIGTDHPVPKDRSDLEVKKSIPSTYVPARNTIFLSYALGWAEVIGAFDIFIGANAVDYSGYPDCRPEFISAFENLANLATASAVAGNRMTIHAPLLHMTKADIIRQGVKLGVNYGLTHSCYDPAPDGAACGSCDSCILRKKGFVEAGIADPTPYQ